VTKPEIKNLPASVRQRLANIADARGEPFQRVLVEYGLERLLYRLSKSKHRDRFVLKGALLFSVWSDAPHRPTMDVDLMSAAIRIRWRHARQCDPQYVRPQKNRARDGSSRRAAGEIHRG